jgi:hypothetical protein
MRSIIVRRVADPSRVFCPAIQGTAITDDRNRSRMGVVVLSFESYQYTRDTVVVLGTGVANPPAVWVRTRKTFPFSSRPIRKPNLHCLSGVVTGTGHKPVGFWPC